MDNLEKEKQTTKEKLKTDISDYKSNVKEFYQHYLNVCIPSIMIASIILFFLYIFDPINVQILLGRVGLLYLFLYTFPLLLLLAAIAIYGLKLIIDHEIKKEYSLIFRFAAKVVAYIILLGYTTMMVLQIMFKPYND